MTTWFTPRLRASATWSTTFLPYAKRLMPGMDRMGSFALPSCTKMGRMKWAGDSQFSLMPDLKVSLRRLRRGLEGKFCTKEQRASHGRHCSDPGCVGMCVISAAYLRCDIWCALWDSRLHQQQLGAIQTIVDEKFINQLDSTSCRMLLTFVLALPFVTTVCSAIAERTTTGFLDATDTVAAPESTL